MKNNTPANRSMSNSTPIVQDNPFQPLHRFLGLLWRGLNDAKSVHPDHPLSVYQAGLCHTLSDSFSLNTPVVVPKKP
jgi:hypothetical protein